MAASSEKLLLVIAPYYEDIVAELERGAGRALEAAGYGRERLEVPGAFEIPAAVAAAARYDDYVGYVALGCVIRGETDHYDYVCAECARGLMELATRERLAIGFGVLTVENRAQAVERAALDGRDKGGEAARAAVAMISVLNRFGPRS